MKIFTNKSVRALLLLVIVTMSLASCKIRYRHQVEGKTSVTNYKYGAGGWIRYDGYSDVAGDMEIAVGEYAKKGNNVKVQLVGVVHLADRDYYTKLQKVLDKADLVLWEGVKVAGQKNIKKAMNSKKPGMYTAMAHILGLISQKEGIDYNRKHFKHCDITMPRSSLQGNSNLKQMQQAMKAAQQILPLKRQLGAFVNMRKMEDYMKHTYATAMSAQRNMDFKAQARQIAQMRRILGTFLQRFPNNKLLRQLDNRLKTMERSFKQMATIIIEKRNVYVMNALAKELKTLGNPKKPFTIAIFYGAAHNDDFEKRMVPMGYKRTKMTWYKAWKINSRR